MSNISIADYVALAEACYADFSGAYGYNKLTHQYLYDEIAVRKSILAIGKNSPNDSDDTSETIRFADYITSRYDVIAHHHDQAGDGFFTSDILNGSGFSATLFQDKASKAYVLALKGSKGAQDLLGADLNDIVFDGLAHHQIVGMYNFWQSLTQTEYHPATIKTDWTLTAEYAAKRLKASARQESYSLERFLAEKGLAGQGYFNDSNVLKAVPNHPFGNVIRQVVIDTSEANKQSGKGLDIRVSTTGHSLGGHLSVVFSRLFPQATLHTYMVNGAGEGGKNNPVASDNQTNIRELFAALGGAEAYEKDKITSLRGNKNINFTAMDSSSSPHLPE